MRYFKFTLVCGALAALFALGLFELRAFAWLDAKLALFLGQPLPALHTRLTQYWFVAFFAFGTAWCTADLGRPLLRWLIVIFAAAEIVAGVWVFNLFGTFFSPFASLVALGSAFALALAYQQTAAGQRKRDLRNLLGQRVSEAVFHHLLESDAPVDAGGEERAATVVVCELFHHDRLTASLAVADYVRMVNGFLRNAGDFLIGQGAYLEGGSGESVRVVFGAPLPDAEHGARACAAALGLVERLDAVNEECLRQWGERFDYRVGISSGNVILAAYGSVRLGSYSITGEAADFARRLCATNLVYGSRILLSNDTFALAEDALEVRPMELIQRGGEENTREEVYELLGARGALPEAQRSQRDLFWKAIVFFREEKWSEALTHFRLAQEVPGGDAPAQYYIRRIEALTAQRALPPEGRP